MRTYKMKAAIQRTLTNLKISLKNLKRNIFDVLILIVGSMIATALIGGSLSLNDTVVHHNLEKIRKNFGNIDIIVSKGGSFMMIFPSSRFFNRVEIENFLDELNVDYRILGSFQMECIVNKKSGEELQMALMIGADEEELGKFVGKKLSFEDGVIVSENLAERLGLKIGDEIVVNLPNGRKTFKISYVGTRGLLNYRGKTGRFAGSVFIDEKITRSIFGYSENLVTDLFIDVEDEDSKRKVVDELRKRFKFLEVLDVSEFMKNKPSNKFLGYFVMIFASFAVVSGAFLLSNFFLSLFNARRRTIAILKVMGYGRIDIFILLFTEGGIYVILSSLMGTFLGPQIAKMVLGFVEKAKEIFPTSFPSPVESMNFYVKPHTLLLTLILGSLVPLFILFILSLRASKLPVVEVLHEKMDDVEERSNTKPFWLFLIPSVMLILFIIFKDSYFLFLLINSILLILPFVIGGRISYLIFPTLSILFTALTLKIPIFEGSKLSEVAIYITRGGVYFISSILLVVGNTIFLKRLFEYSFSKFPSMILSWRLALSYVSRNRKRTGFLMVMFGVVIFGVVVTTIVPYNIVEFLDDKFKQGFLGYDFAIFVNPVKSFMGLKEVNWSDELKRSYFEKFDRVILLPIKIVDEKGKNRFTMAGFIDVKDEDPNVKIVGSMMGTDNLWDHFRMGENVCVAGTFSKDFSPFPGEEIELMIPMNFFQYSNPNLILGKFKIIGIYKPQSQMIPVEMLLPVSTLPENYRSGIVVYLGKLGKDVEAEKIKRAVMRDANFPLHITGEFTRIYRGLNLLANLGVRLLYFAMITGFSGLILTMIRSIFSRRRTIGTLKALGITSLEVSSFFVIEFSFVLLSSLIMGILAGTIESWDITRVVLSAFDDGRIDIPILKLVILFFTVFSIGFIVSIVSSMISWKLKPSKVLGTFQ